MGFEKVKKKKESGYLHNKLTSVMPDFGQQRHLPPLDKPPQHVSSRVFHTEGIAVLKNHQAHQHHADIQLLVVLG